MLSASGRMLKALGARAAPRTFTSGRPLATKGFWQPEDNERQQHLAVHRDSTWNNADIPFDFTEENYKQVDWILSKYPENYKQSAIMPLLDLAQRQCNNWLPLSALNKVADVCEVPPMRVYEVATFYTMYNRNPVGKYFIQLCGTTPCMLCGSETIKSTIEEHLGFKCGETTKDGMFSMIEVECLGACVNAPMIQINDDFYEDLTPENTIKLLDALAKDEVPPAGPYNVPRKGCIGPQGKTTLHGEPAGPYCRDLDAVKKQLAEAEAAKKAEAAAKK